jgi:hypothetical protein
MINRADKGRTVAPLVHRLCIAAPKRFPERNAILLSLTPARFVKIHSGVCCVVFLLCVFNPPKMNSVAPTATLGFLQYKEY